MVESHFQFRSRPFRVQPDVSRYYPSASMEAARERILRCIERAEGMALVVGAPGSGKTMLLHVIANMLAANYDLISLGTTPLCSRRALLQTILHGLGLDYASGSEGELRLSLIDYLQGDSWTTRGLVLLVDEANGLPLKLLEELRMLTNVARAGEPAVHVVFAGPSALEERIGHKQHAGLQQRIACRSYLTALDFDETCEYVCGQITSSGRTPGELLDEACLTKIFESTDGNPRLINQLCEHALVLTATADAVRLTAEIVEEAWYDLQQLPPPSRTSTASAEASSASVLEFDDLDGDSFEPDAALYESDSSERLFEPKTAPVTAPNDPFSTFEHIEEQLNTMENPMSHPASQPNPVSQPMSPSANSNPFGSDFSDEQVIENAPHPTAQLNYQSAGLVGPARKANYPDLPTAAIEGPSATMRSQNSRERAYSNEPMEAIPVWVRDETTISLEDDPVYPAEAMRDVNRSVGPNLGIVREIETSVDVSEQELSLDVVLPISGNSNPTPQKPPGKTDTKSIFGNLFSSLKKS